MNKNTDIPDIAGLRSESIAIRSPRLDLYLEIFRCKRTQDLWVRADHLYIALGVDQREFSDGDEACSPGDASGFEGLPLEVLTWYATVESWISLTSPDFFTGDSAVDAEMLPAKRRLMVPLSRMGLIAWGFVESGQCMVKDAIRVDALCEFLGRHHHLVPGQYVVSGIDFKLPTAFLRGIEIHADSLELSVNLGCVETDSPGRYWVDECSAHIDSLWSDHVEMAKVLARVLSAPFIMAMSLDGDE